MIPAIGVILGVLLTGGQAPPVRVYVFTAPDAGFTDEATKGRMDATKDLKEALSGKKRIVLVDDREQAQVVLEILGRSKEDTGDYRKHDYNAKYTQSVKAHTVRVKLSVGEYSTEIVGDTVTSIKRKAAGEAAGKIDDWVKANATRLAQVR